ncbi:uncharacterized protein LOC119774671 [Cyprinodon tularosa]|uniref:uncharacterized protein LOC119774671 n=1 Tax=Cyprinodon tularosa TaxID=77115 RepID=UPI0018E23261|nr:uncharacterized protein LOC119774671 [Cyprinodon tularosa]
MKVKVKEEIIELKIEDRRKEEAELLEITEIKMEEADGEVETEQEDGGEAGMERKVKRIKMEEQNLHSSTWTEPDSSGPQAVTADMVCWSPLSTSPKHCPADSPQTQIHKLQQQQMVSHGKLGRLQHSLQIQKAKLEYQESMLATQKALIDNQASELESLKTMLEEMRRRLLDLEQSHASHRCNAQRVKAQDVATAPQPPMANLQSVPGSTYIMILTSSPFQAFPSCLATPGQASPSYTSMPTEVSPSHKPTPAQVSPSHKPTPAQVSPSHKPAPAQVSPSHKPTPAQRFPNLTVDQWHKIRSRVNERLRCPRKFDRVTPRYGFNYD